MKKSENNERESIKKKLGNTIGCLLIVMGFSIFCLAIPMAIAEDTDIYNVISLILHGISGSAFIAIGAYYLLNN